MSIILSLLGELLLFVARSLVEIPLIWLGEIVRWAVTLGRHKPRWDCYGDEDFGAFYLLSEVSLWIGVATAVSLAALIRFLFFP